MRATVDGLCIDEPKSKRPEPKEKGVLEGSRAWPPGSSGTPGRSEIFRVPGSKAACSFASRLL